MAALPYPSVVPALAYGPDGTRLVSGSFPDDRLLILGCSDRSLVARQYCTICLRSSITRG